MKTKVTLEYLGNTLFPAPRPRLENDPMCGLTTGGSSECFWDCEYVSDPNFGSIISNLECLLDCFEEVTFIEFLKVIRQSFRTPACTVSFKITSLLVESVKELSCEILIQ